MSAPGRRLSVPPRSQARSQPATPPASGPPAIAPRRDRSRRARASLGAVVPRARRLPPPVSSETSGAGLSRPVKKPRVPHPSRLSSGVGQTSLDPWRGVVFSADDETASADSQEPTSNAPATAPFAADAPPKPAASVPDDSASTPATEAWPDSDRPDGRPEPIADDATAWPEVDRGDEDEPEATEFDSPARLDRHRRARLRR